MTAAALGTTLALETLDGVRDVELKPGTQPAQVITLRNLGVGHLHANGRGDLHVHVDVQVPTTLDDEQEALLRRFAELRGEQRPAGSSSPTHPGVFSKLREKLANW
jgi:molecular chaperone DnaJ